MEISYERNDNSRDTQRVKSHAEELSERKTKERVGKWLVTYVNTTSAKGRDPNPDSELEKDISEAINSDMELDTTPEAAWEKTTSFEPKPTLEVVERGQLTPRLQACSREMLLKILQTGSVGQGIGQGNVVIRTGSLCTQSNVTALRGSRIRQRGVRAGRLVRASRELKCVPEEFEESMLYWAREAMYMRGRNVGDYRWLQQQYGNTVMNSWREYWLVEKHLAADKIPGFTNAMKYKLLRQIIQEINDCDNFVDDVTVHYPELWEHHHASNFNTENSRLGFFGRIGRSISDRFAVAATRVGLWQTAWELPQV